ncbi:type II toxin-antitoxin system RelE/ParE family toxin [Sulfurimonas sp.]
MKIIIETGFSEPLFQILTTIAKDKKSASIKFNKDLKKKIKSLLDSPFMCRASIYFEDTKYRDLICKGYTIIYKVEDNEIKIFDIFKWQDR